jgi:hypothetical protein
MEQKNIWKRDRFKSGQKVTMEMARLHLRAGARDDLVETMRKRIEGEQEKVKGLVIEEIESLMRLGAEITGMTYLCKSTGTRRLCVTPKQVRSSYLQDMSDLNVERVHWIFHALPYGTHRDVLTQRMSHMDLVVQGVVLSMNVQWEEMKEGESNAHKNCIEHTYARYLNEKKTTVIGKIKNGDADGLHRRPYAKSPKSLEEAMNANHYKRGKRMYFWESRTEGVHVVGAVSDNKSGKRSY